MDEAEAVERMRRGDIGGLEVLVHRYQTQALRAAQLITRDPALAEDVVQSGFVRAYERIRQFDTSRPFGPWFLRSVVNAALQAAARDAKWRARSYAIPSDSPSLLDLVEDPDAGPEAAYEAIELKSRIRCALDRLSPAQRAAIVLRYYLGLNEAEMVERLASPPGTVKRRLHDARRRMKALLGGLVRTGGVA